MQHPCGLCSALSAVFRRLMCIAPSRRGSQESYYNSQHGSGRASDDAADPTAVLIRMEEEGDEKEEDSERRRRESGTKEEEPSSEEEEMARRRIGSSSGPAELVAAARAGGPGCPSLVRTLSSGELVLLSRLAPREAETRGGGTLRRCCGRFLTVHKRRRRRITTRCLHEVPALLDDLHHGQVQCVLDKVGLWPFNAFILDTATGGRSLPVLCVHLFHWYGLMDHFSLDVVRIWKFFTLVEEGYHSTNPYHNAIHATDVTQAMHCFLQEEKIRAHLTPLEIMCALIAAVTHDLDHPGVNQPFLIATSNHLAALYENTSVLENHHWRSAIGCLLESQLAEEVASVRPELERQISSLILATDITRQQEFLTRFKKYLSDDDLDMREPDHRHFILQISLKCADISNPCRPWEISRKWSQKVCEEFFRQGDYERQLDLPVTALCDRHTSSVPKIQAGFFRFVVAPLFEEWHKFLRTPLSHSMMRHLRLNQAKWEKLIQDEMAEETRTEISEAEEVSDEASIPGSRGEGGGGEGGGTGGVSGQQRRHSVPASIHRLTVPGSSSSHRRESLPPVPDTRRRMTLGPILQLHADEEVISLLSSPSLGSTDSNSDERPVSAENLLPDVSIASMTSSGNVPPRLLSVPPRLTRQQTFPPLQPYVRQRYLSTAGEILQGSLSTSSGSSSDMESRPSLVPTEKENVDPAAESKTQRSTTKPPSQLSSKQRRGSAPVSSCQYLAPPGGDLAGVGRPLRRGSVPVATATTGGGGGPASCGTAGFLQLPSSPALPPPGSNSSSRQQSAILKPRVSKENSNSDSSSSSERLPTPLPVTLQGGGGGGGGLTEEESRRRGRRCSKKQLRRRSSGGPETFRCLKESSYRRRGSLPIEVLANTLTGRNNNNSVKESMRH